MGAILWTRKCGWPADSCVRSKQLSAAVIVDHETLLAKSGVDNTDSTRCLNLSHVCEMVFRDRMGPISTTDGSP